MSRSLALAVLLAPTVALAQMAGGDAIIKQKTLTQDAAEQIALAARKVANTLDSPVYKGAKTKMHVHVFGREGTLMAATQTPGAWPGSADIATRKARTSWLFRFPTGAIGDLSRPEKPAKGSLYGIEHSNGGLITFPGGLPLITASGDFVGSIGVSGDTVEMDDKVAQAGADALKKMKNATIDIPALSSVGAQAVVAAAKAKAQSLDSPIFKGAKTKMHVFVVGVDGLPLAAWSDDNAWAGSSDIAHRKARTSWYFKLPTGVIGSLSRPEQEAKGPLYGIEISNAGLITFPGGLPLLDAAGNCVGAIGVSGDSVEADDMVAKAGVDAFQAMIAPKMK
jgi:uncharacterized protein GlcG (DUF336 family)